MDIVVSDLDDLSTHPTVVTQQHSTVIIGDVHGNALKILHFLLKVGAVSWPNQDEAALDKEQLYQQFYNHYHASFSADSITAIRELIQKLQVNPKSPYLRFLGDELGDRGKNDLISLWLFKHLDQGGVEFENVFSNHVLKFYQEYQRYKSQRQGFKPAVIDCYRSLESLYQGLEQNWFDERELEDLLKIHQKHLAIVGCALHHGGLALYSHAPVSHDIAKHMAEKLNTFYIDDTPSHKAWSLFKIKQVFNQLLAADDFDRLFDKDIIYELSLEHAHSEALYPFENAIWNRKYESLKRETKHPEYTYLEFSAHGHDVKDPLYGEAHIACLDNIFGKAPNLEQCGQDVTNPLLYRDEQQLTPALIKKIEVELVEQVSHEIHHALLANNKKLAAQLFIKFQPLMGEPAFLGLSNLFSDLGSQYLSLIEDEFAARDKQVFSSACSLTELSENINLIQEAILQVQARKLPTEKLTIIEQRWTAQQHFLVEQEHKIKSALALWQKVYQEDLEFNEFGYVAKTVNDAIYLHLIDEVQTEEKIQYIDEQFELDIQQALEVEYQGLKLRAQTAVEPIDHIRVEKSVTALCLIRDKLVNRPLLEEQFVSLKTDLVQSASQASNTLTIIDKYIKTLAPLVDRQLNKTLLADSAFDTLRKLIFDCYQKLNNSLVPYPQRLQIFEQDNSPQIIEQIIKVQQELQQRLAGEIASDEAVSQYLDSLQVLIKLMPLSELLPKKDFERLRLCSFFEDSIDSQKQHINELLQQPYTTELAQGLNQRRKLLEQCYLLINQARGIKNLVNEQQDYLLQLDKAFIEKESKETSALEFKKTLFVATHYYLHNFLKPRRAVLESSFFSKNTKEIAAVDKKITVLDLLLNLLEAPKVPTTVKLQQFINTFQQEKLTLMARTTVLGINVSNNPNMQKVLAATVSQVSKVFKANISNGHSFAKEIDAVITTPEFQALVQTEQQKKITP